MRTDPSWADCSWEEERVRVVSGCLLEGDDAGLMLLMMIKLRLPGQSHTHELKYFSHVHC